MMTNESSRMTSNFSNTSRVKHKIIFLGDQHVGKTCIIERFMYDVFDEKSHPTVGVDFLAKTLHIDDKNIRLQLWDTAGQERFRSLIPSYLRDATCAVIVFDVTKKETFDNSDKWIKEYRENRGTEAPCVLVANKIDLNLSRVVSDEEGKKKALEYGMNYFEISAKTGENVSNMFRQMAMQLQPAENSLIVSSQIAPNLQQQDNIEDNTKGQIISPELQQQIQQQQQPKPTPTIKLGEPLNKQQQQQQNPNNQEGKSEQNQQNKGKEQLNAQQNCC